MEYSYRHYIGLIGFIILFAGLIPILIIEIGKYFNIENSTYIFIQGYMANLDLLATCLSFQNGPFKFGYFEYLYKRTDIFIGYLSFNVIALVSLVSLLFVILLRAHKQFNNSKYNTNIIFFILSQFIIMVCITFLFSNRFVIQFMNYVHDILKTNFSFSKSTNWPIVVSSGLILSVFVIYIESIVNNSISNSILTNFIKNRSYLVSYALKKEI
jgi:hypothetical protein